METEGYDRQMKFPGWLVLLALAGCATVPDDAARKELVPTGKPRVGIGVGAAPSAFWATRDPATGKPRGVTVNLGQALADKLGVPLELVVYPKVDRAGVRVGGIAGTTTARTAIATLKNTKVLNFRTVEEIVAKMKAGEVDAIALGRESLRGLVPQLPGARVLDGYFHAAGTAVAVPKGKPAALAYVTRFIEEAKTNGILRRALDDAGFADLAMAPPEPGRSSR